MAEEIIKLADLPSNSHKSKEEIEVVEEKKLQRVVKKPVKRKKKSLGQKFAAVFTENDTKSVGAYLIQDVLIPAAQDTIVDMVSNGIEMLIFGSEGGATRKKSQGRKRGYTNYNSISDGDIKRSKKYWNKGSQNRYAMEDIIVDSRGEAYEILRELDELIGEYGVASVADLNDLIGETGEFIDNKWGWYDLGSAKIIRCREGYLIDLPRVKSLDD